MPSYTSQGWRAARPEDDDTIVGLATKLYAEDPSPAPVPPEHTRRTLAALRDEPIRGMVVVLEVDQAVRGYALLIAFWSNELGGNVCEVDEIYIDRDVRSRGFASNLFRAVAKGDGLWPTRPAALALQVTRDNARARKLYRHLGFRDSTNALMVWRLEAEVLSELSTRESTGGASSGGGHP